MPARRAVAFGVSAAALLALTGCDKPTPLVTVVAGSTSVHSEAQCYASRAGAQVTQADCTRTQHTPPVLKVAAGETIGIDVSKQVAEHGWFVAINQQRLTKASLSGHYYHFALSQANLEQAPLELEILAVNKGGKTNRGVWVFEIEQR